MDHWDIIESLTMFQSRLQKNRLALDDHVVAYLGSMEASESDLVDREAPNEGEDDFS